VRCLFTSKTGSLGHLLPLLPVAEAARAAGDEVAVAASVDRRHDVEAAGYAFFPAGLALGDLADHYRLAMQRMAASGLELHPRLGWDLENTYAQIFPTVQAPVMATDLAKVVEEFRPDVVVCDVGEFGGPVAAAVAGVPCASHGFGVPIPESLAKEAARWAAPMWEARGMTAPDDGGMYRDLHFSPCPPSLDPGDGWAGGPVQLVGPPRREPLPPSWLLSLPARPTVYVTLGTAAGRDIGLLDVAVSGLAGLDLNVVVTVGRDGDPARLEDAGTNISAHRFIPQENLLPSCSLVVCHGGSGTLLGALAHGVPVVVLPHMADHFRNADAVRRSGCGVSLDEDAQTPSGIEVAVRTTLEDQSVASAAANAKTEIANLPTPAAAVARLREMVTVRSGGS
jgi:UDP:flavonoid glycosyltransferase YjiC (YdhE family)